MPAVVGATVALLASLAPEAILMSDKQQGSTLSFGIAFLGIPLLCITERSNRIFLQPTVLTVRSERDDAYYSIMILWKLEVIRFTVLCLAATHSVPPAGAPRHLRLSRGSGSGPQSGLRHHLDRLP